MIKIISLIVVLFSLQSCKITADNPRICNIEEVDITQQITDIWYDYYIDKKYIGKDDNIINIMQSCYFDKDKQQYSITSNVKWSGIWNTQNQITAKIDFISNNVANITLEKLKADISSKLIPSPSFAKGAGVIAVIAGGVTWFLLEPISATAFFSASYSLIFNNDTLTTFKNLYAKLTNSDFEVKDVKTLLALIDSQEALKNLLNSDEDKKILKILTNSSDIEILNEETKILFTTLTKRLKNISKGTSKDFKNTIAKMSPLIKKNTTSKKFCIS